MASWLLGSKAKVDVKIDVEDKPYVLGDRVECRITLTSDKDITIEEGYVGLVCDVTFLSNAPSRGNYLSLRLQEKSVIDYTSTHVFTSGLTLTGGIPQTHRVSFDTPPDKAPTYRGEKSKVEWTLKVWCNIKKAKNIVGEVELLVFAPTPPSLPEDAPITVSRSTDDCELILSLPKKVIAQGETVSAVLRVKPLEDFDVSAIEAQLICDEGQVPITECNLTLAGKTQFKAWQVQTFPFEFTVPSGYKPTITARNFFFSTGWRLVGVLGRTMRDDYLIVQNLQVYSTKPAS